MKGPRNIVALTAAAKIAILALALAFPAMEVHPQAASGKADQPLFPDTTFVLEIRSAFSLTPDMVKALQSIASGQEGRAGSSSKSSAAGEAQQVPWGEKLVRTVPQAANLEVRVSGKNLTANIRISPSLSQPSTITLVIQSQVTIRNRDNSYSVNNSVQVVSLPAGGMLFFYPLGFDDGNGAPFAMEIKVNKQARK